MLRTKWKLPWGNKTFLVGEVFKLTSIRNDPISFTAEWVYTGGVWGSLDKMRGSFGKKTWGCLGSGGDPGRLGFLLYLRGMMKPKENYPRQMN